MGNCMRALPRATASPRFTSDVKRAIRAAEAPRRPALTWRIAAAFAMAACLIAVIQIGSMQHERRKMQALRVEQQKIQAELAAVKEPVVVLENDKGDRVIMDLNSASVQPASLKTYD